MSLYNFERNIKMERTTIKEIFATPEAFGGKEVTVAGWVRTIRASNAFGFIELNDGSYFTNLQVVFEETKLDNYKNIAKQNVGASLIIKGKIIKIILGAMYIT